MDIDLKSLLQEELQVVKQMSDLVFNLGMQNEQWFLDWADELNAISVR